MVRRRVSSFPPRRLPAVDGRWAAWLRPLWMLVFAGALGVQIWGLLFALHETYVTRPALLAIAMEYEVDGGAVRLSPILRHGSPPGLVPNMRPLAVDGRPLPPHVTPGQLAARILKIPGSVVRLTVRPPDGAIRELAIRRSPAYAAERTREVPLSRDLRLLLRLGFAALTTVSLLGSSLLLFLRCGRDPVAVLIAFAFAGMAFTTDPPIQLWNDLGIGWMVDLSTFVWWSLIVVALGAFPSGRFDPRWLRWLAVAAPVLGYLAVSPWVAEMPQLAIGVVTPLLLILGQAVRFKRLGPGLERQQIKWAALGFFSGFTVVGVALLGVALGPDPAWSPLVTSLYYTIVTCLFSLGFALMPLGLLVSLLGYRLWDADAVIGRTVGYAGITMVIGAVWAGSADIVKSVVSSFLGQDNFALSTGIGAVLVAAVFTPTKSIVLKWSKQRFVKGIGRLHELPKRLAVWREAESAPELGLRALSIIVESVHAEGAALLANGPTQRELVAACDIAEPERLAQPGATRDPRFPVALPLEDDDGPVGTLLLGPRSDGHRYAKSEREALEEITRPLAEALRAVRARMQRELGLERLVSDVQTRLAALEGGGRLSAT